MESYSESNISQHSWQTQAMFDVMSDIGMSRGLRSPNALLRVC